MKTHSVNQLEVSDILYDSTPDQEEDAVSSQSHKISPPGAAFPQQISKIVKKMAHDEIIRIAIQRLGLSSEIKELEMRLLHSGLKPEEVEHQIDETVTHLIEESPELQSQLAGDESILYERIDSLIHLIQSNIPVVNDPDGIEAFRNLVEQFGFEMSEEGVIYIPHGKMKKEIDEALRDRLGITKKERSRFDFQDIKLAFKAIARGFCNWIVDQLQKKGNQLLP